jgi:hypothetical protein
VRHCDFVPLWAGVYRENVGVNAFPQELLRGHAMRAAQRVVA